MLCVSDVVISFVRKTVAGVASLLRLRKPLTTRSEKPGHYEETQVCAPAWIQAVLGTFLHFYILHCVCL